VAGFKSWSKYCGAGRVEYGKDQADNYIRASELRPKVPSMIGNCEWSVRQMLELAKCETDNDARCSFKLLF
jgi:hypothetical protein